MAMGLRATQQQGRKQRNNQHDARNNQRHRTASLMEMLEARTMLAAVVGTGTGLEGQYFDNADFTGATVTRTDAKVDFNWGSNAPASGIGADTFSARWTGQVQAQYSETYTFSTNSDDGVRLWVNGQLIIDNWTVHAPTTNSGSIALQAGQTYDIKMEYYENLNGAVAQLYWSSPSTTRQIIPTTQLYTPGTVAAAKPVTSPTGTGTGLQGQYFDNADFTGTTITRTDPAVNFNWGTGAPANGFGVDTFSVRWTGQIEAQKSETYTFSTSSDDGVRLWVNGQLLINNWTDHAPTTNSGSIALQAGQKYDIKMEFYENGGGAVAQLYWASPTTAKQIVPTSQLYPTTTTTPTTPPPTTPTTGTGTGLLGQYFDSADFTGATVARTDAKVDFDWGNNGPATGIGADTFSARWTGQVEAQKSETYIFSTNSDDGVRLWVNGQLIIDNWTVHAPTTNNGSIALQAGQKYDIKMEYYENLNGAVAQLYWSSPTTTRQIVPTTQLYAATAPTTPTVTVPAAPSGMSASAGSSSSINLSWTDNSSNEAGFKIERKTGSTGTWAQVAQVGAGVTSFTNTGLAAGTQYFYRVCATNSAGDSADSNEASATTQTQTVQTANFYVDASNGSDTNNGTASSPFRSISKAISVASAGQTVLVKNGIYRETLNFTRSGSSSAPITFVAESTGGVIVDGRDSAGNLVRTQLAGGYAQYISIKGFVFRYAKTALERAAVYTNTGWRMEDVVIEQAEANGLTVQGSNITLLRVTAQDNGQQGITGAGANNVLVKDCVVRRNNTGKANPSWKSQTNISGWQAAMYVNGLWYVSPDFSAGGGKWWNSSNITIDGMQAYENVGIGIWFDAGSSANVVIKNSRAYNNRGLTQNYQGMGIQIELVNIGPFLVENNYVANNTGHGISVSSARNVTVRNNTFINDPLCLLDYPRGTDFTLRNLTLTGNRFKNGAIETWGGTWTNTSARDKLITINYDTFDNNGGTLVKWGNTNYNSLSTIRSVLGIEMNGTLGTVSA